jgi:hypothetical protein
MLLTKAWLYTILMSTKLTVAEQHSMEAYWMKIYPNWPRNVQIMGIN